MLASTLNDLAGLIVQMGLAERVTEVKDRMKWSKAELARAAEVSSASVTHWLSGATKEMSYESAKALQAATGYRADWLIYGKGPKRLEPAQQQDDGPVYAGRRSGVRSVPIVGLAKMGDRGFYEEISSIPGAGDGQIEIATADPNAYGLRVRGNSMAPAIRDGWYVLVEPNAAPAVGEYVLVKVKDGQRMVKELLYQRPDCIEVLSVNNGERTTIYNDDLESIQAIAAVVPPSKWRPD